MHENEIYSSITISFRYISQLLSSPPTLFTMLLCVSFNGILTDINRSRDEWRLTLKYYACRLPSSLLLSSVFFFGFFSRSRSDLNHLGNQVHFAKNINELITYNISDEILTTATANDDITFYRIYRVPTYRLHPCVLHYYSYFPCCK